MPGLTLRRIRARVASAPPSAILGAAWLWLVIYGLPGQMVPDAAEHLRESRSGLYTDSHPPVLNVLWRVADSIIAGQLLVFLLQTIVFALGLHAVLRRLLAPRTAVWTAAALLVFPPVMTTLAVVWKDALMAGLLLLGVAGLLDGRRRLQLAALVALYAATAFRYNALAGTLPPILLLFQWRTGMHWIARYAIAFAAWLAITFAAISTNAALTDRQMHLWHSSLALFDIVGTLYHVDGTLPDSELERLFAGTEPLVHTNMHAHLRKAYKPRNYASVVVHHGLVDEEAMWSMPIFGTEPAPQAQRDAVTRTWKEVLSTHPVEYAQHRLAVMYEVLSLGRRSAYWAVTQRTYIYPADALEQGFSTSSSSFQRGVTSVLTMLWRRTPLFEPSLYCCVALAILALTRRQRDLFAILTSGLLMEASLLVLASTPDYRYSHWMVLCTSIAVVVLVARRMRSQGVIARGGDDPARGRVAAEDPVDAGTPRGVAERRGEPAGLGADLQHVELERAIAERG